jgi:uncharacterized delta-60 repeat protein
MRIPRRGLVTAAPAAVAAMFAVLATPAVAAEGDLDPTFSADGFAQQNFETGGGAEGVASVMLGDGGTIVVTGLAKGSGYGAVRYGPDGTPDPGFGSGGASYFKPPDVLFASVTDATLGPGGRVVIGGFADPLGASPDTGDATVGVFNSAGLADPTFGNDPPNPVGDGFVRTPIPGPDPFDVGMAVAVDAQRRTLLAGRSSDSTTHTFLIRYLEDGKVDPSFGIKTFTLGGDDAPHDVAILPDGKLLMLARIDGQWALVRFTEGGELDTGYASGGIALLPGLASPDAEAGALALQPDGNVLVLATIGTFPNWSGRLARVDVSGALDPGFGTGGVAELPAPGTRAFFSDVAVADDGRAVVAGSSSPSGSRQATAWRLLANGQPDPAFGSNGIVTRPPDSGFSSVAIQPDRRIVLGGTIDADPSDASIDEQFLTLRMIGDETAPDTLIKKAPKKLRLRKKAKVKFRASDDVNTSFECALKQPKRKRGGSRAKLRFSPCESPEKTKRLKRAGKHRFLVRAIDPAGNVDSSPAKAKIKVKPKRR